MELLIFHFNDNKRTPINTYYDNFTHYANKILITSKSTNQIIGKCLGFTVLFPAVILGRIST